MMGEAAVREPGVSTVCQTIMGTGTRQRHLCPRSLSQGRKSPSPGHQNLRRQASGNDGDS